MSYSNYNDGVENYQNLLNLEGRHVRPLDD